MRVRHSGDRRRRWLAPEVVQTSAMDCGPAALAAMCAGFGLPASYGRLREACQTGVDGTSIDTIEDVANGLGLDAAQVMLPVDQLLDPDAAALPAIVVTRLPNGFTHFVVAWRRHGPLVQVMDPAVGRRFPSKRRFLADCHVHAMPVPADAWRRFASSESSLRILGRRLARLGVGDADRRIAHALADPGWRGLATLDAGVRVVTAVAGAGMRRGDHTGALLARLVDEADRIAPPWWSATPAGRDPESGAERVVLRGAVLVQVEGRRPEPLPADGLVPELVAARTEEQPHPLRTLARMARAEPGGRARLVGLATGAVLVALGVVGQAALLRAVLDRLGSDRDHAPLVAALLALAAALAALELWAASVSLGLGRRLERRLRLSFAAKIPRLPDRYLHSRPTSDMAERNHSLHRLRVLTEMGGQAARSLATVVVTVVALAWLDPTSAVPAAVAAIGAVAVPLAFQPALAERDLRLRTHQGALGQLVLDALLGVVPTRVHRARSAMLRAHDDLSIEWQRTAMSFQRTAAVADGMQGAAAAGLVGWLLFAYLPGTGGAGHALLFVFLALTIPVSGQDAALALRRWPPLRTGVLRLLEPLGAPEEPAPAPGPGPDRPGGADLSLEHVTVVVGGHAVLQEVDLHAGPGEHVALVGASGAGKSTLLGLLLGWHRPAGGTVWVDGAALDGDQVERLRADSAWVDPSVQLWNRSLAANLRYGAAGEARPLDHVVAAAGLGPVVGNLPLGLDTPLGEGGGLVSGGEGQRVRFGRALGRPAARLVVLDEPFRGLDRPSRAALLEDARATWRHATLLCATHDVGETASFDRVLVLDGGRVVEDGRPADLAADAGSRYRGLLDAETAVRDLLFGAKGWRRMRLVGCRLHERDGAPV